MDAAMQPLVVAPGPEKPAGPVTVEQPVEQPSWTVAFVPLSHALTGAEAVFSLSRATIVDRSAVISVPLAAGLMTARVVGVLQLQLVT
eukprot:SAG31_NODE_3059_length_4678_cov_1.833657_6_plen_88_part_00